MRELWMCGQIKGEELPGGRYAWDFQGIFTTEEKARKACRNNRYFIQPVNMDEEQPDESVMNSRGYYPLAEPP